MASCGAPTHKGAEAREHARWDVGIEGDRQVGFIRRDMTRTLPADVDGFKYV